MERTDFVRTLYFEGDDLEDVGKAAAMLREHGFECELVLSISYSDSRGEELAAVEEELPGDWGS